MNRDQIIEAMAKAVHESMSKQAVIEYLDNPFEASLIATAALAVIEAHGLAIVPVEATDKALKQMGSAFYGDKSDVMAGRMPSVYAAMIKAGKL